MRVKSRIVAARRNDRDEVNNNRMPHCQSGTGDEHTDNVLARTGSCQSRSDLTTKQLSTSQSSYPSGCSCCNNALTAESMSNTCSATCKPVWSATADDIQA
jgi:hypothetical protein